MGIAGHLREDDDRGIPRGILADGRREADVGLQQPVVAALAGAVQKEDRGPARLRRVVGRDVDLVVIRSAADGDVSIEESCLCLLD